MPDNDETVEYLQKIKAGAVLSGEFVQPRNYKFLQKIHVLFHTAYDYFSEHLETDIEYRGQKVRPSYDRFRKELVILAGHYEPVFNIRGELRVEAKSLSFAKCTEQEAEKIFSDCINAALKNVYRFSIDEEQLRTIVDEILAFA